MILGRISSDDDYENDDEDGDKKDDDEHHNLEASSSISTNTIWGFPEYKYSAMGPQTLF